MTARLWSRVPAGVAALVLSLVTACSKTDHARFVSVNAPVIVLRHLRIIDGTGAPAKDDQTIVIDGGRIGVVGNSADVPAPANAHVMDLRGRTVMPGLVGMHEHLYYELGDWQWLYPAQASFTKLYLANGVTTIRTAGTFDLAGDLRIKHLIDNGQAPGPTIHVTSPYIGLTSAQPDPARVVRDVGNWADQGATSFKAYTGLGRQALYAAIQVAHARGLKVTGHLCAVGFQDAAAFGIDNLEHGLIVDSEFLPGRTPDVCPDWNDRLGAILAMDVSSPAIRQLISNLVSRRIAVTSTLAIHETLTPKPDVELRTLLMLAPRLQDDYRARHATRLEPKAHEWWARVLKKEMEFERAFVAAGGWLMAGVDPSGGIVAGFGDQRQLELLVEAGFSAEAAIRIATANGAAWLNESRRVGTIAAGLDADLIVVRGDPSRNISDVRNVEVVFKRGVGYDPAKLIASVQGTVGELDVRWALRPPYGPVIGVLVLLLLARRLWLRQTPKRRD